MALTPKNPAVDVYSAGEIAQAAGVPVARVEALVAAGRVRSARGSAPATSPPIRRLPPCARCAPTAAAARRMLFDKPEFAHASAKMPVAAASAVHAGIAATLVLISTIGLPQAAETRRARRAGDDAARVHRHARDPAAAAAAAVFVRRHRLRARSAKARHRSTARCRVRKAPKPVEAAPKPSRRRRRRR